MNYIAPFTFYIKMPFAYSLFWQNEVKCDNVELFC